jgi:hypothetical protein
MHNSSKSIQTASSFDVRLCGSVVGSAGRVGVFLSGFEAEELIFLDIWPAPFFNLIELYKVDNARFRNCPILRERTENKHNCIVVRE